MGGPGGLSFARRAHRCPPTQDIRDKFTLKKTTRVADVSADPVVEPVEQPDGGQETMPPDESIEGTQPAEQQPADQQSFALQQAEDPVTEALSLQEAHGGRSIFAAMPLTAEQRASQQLRVPPRYLKSQLVRVAPGRSVFELS